MQIYVVDYIYSKSKMKFSKPISFGKRIKTENKRGFYFIEYYNSLFLIRTLLNMNYQN